MKHTNSHIGTDPEIPIVYEDSHLLVIDKPHELLSQEDHTGDPDVVTLCKQYLSKMRGKNGNVYLGLLHRLDRPVGGLMMLAKTPQAAKRLSDQIRDRTVQKTYRAVVHGEPPRNGLLNHHLVKNRNRNRVETVSPDHPDAKEARMSFVKVGQKKDLALLSVHLQTGRPHQIRVQLAAEGYPVWGDYKYGLQKQPEGRTIALRAVGLVLEHPVQKEEMRLELPEPAGEPWKRFQI